MAASSFNYHYLTLALLVICFVVTLFITMRLQREVAEDAAPTTPHELFGPLEKAYHAGLMHEAEYLRIREQMARKAEEADVPPAKPSGAKEPRRPADEWASWDVPGE